MYGWAACITTILNDMCNIIATFTSKCLIIAQYYPVCFPPMSSCHKFSLSCLLAVFVACKVVFNSQHLSDGLLMTDPSHRGSEVKELLVGRSKDALASSAKLPNRSNFPEFCEKKIKKQKKQNPVQVVRYSVAAPIALNGIRFHVLCFSNQDCLIRKIIFVFLFH